MEKQQAKTTKLLADLNDQLGVLSKELGELDTNFKEKNEELTGLQTQAALMEKRLAAAPSSSRDSLGKEQGGRPTSGI